MSRLVVIVGSLYKAVSVERYPYIRRSKSLGATGELHSEPGLNKAVSPSKEAISLWHTTVLLPPTHVLHMPYTISA